MSMEFSHFADTEPFATKRLSYSGFDFWPGTFGSNVGDGIATSVQLTDTLPTYTSFVTASDGGMFDGTSVTWPPFSVLAQVT